MRLRDLDRGEFARGDAPTDLMNYPAEEDSNTAEIAEAEAGERSLEMELASSRAKEIDSGPTVANDPREFPPGILDAPLEKKRVATPRQQTDPSGPPAGRSKMWLWAVLLLVSIGLGIGAGVVFNKLDRELIANRSEVNDPAKPLQLFSYASEKTIADVKADGKWTRDTACDYVTGFDQIVTRWMRLTGYRSRWTADGQWRW